MRTFFKIIGNTIILALAIYYLKGNLKLAFQVSITIVGIIVLIYSTIGIYKSLKNVGFKFRYISKDTWIKLGTIYLSVWGVFILTLSDGLILVPCIQIPLILIGLLIYDRIACIFKK